MKIIPCDQGSPAWYAARRGIPTASNMGRIITPAKAEYASGAITYIAELIAEAKGWSSEFKGTPDTERGVYLEREARDWLSAARRLDVHEVGFCLEDNGLYGASPDGLLDDGVTPVEIKCPDTHTFVKWLIAGGLPEQHKAQVHGEMLVTGADRCLFVAYCEHFDPLFIEVRRDAFTTKLATAVDRFTDELATLQRKILGAECDQLIASLAAARAAIKPPTPPKRNPITSLSGKF